MATGKEKKKKSSALKRHLQSLEARARNKAFRSKVSTAIKAANKATAEEKQASLNVVYSLMDKGVKKGVFKQNKASRIKSRMTKRVLAQA